MHEQISGTPTLSQIRTALRYFQVARNFAGLGEDDAAQAVADALQQIHCNSSSSPEQNVVDLATRFKDRFNQFNVSAASKLLWLKCRLPYVIYDSRAANALRDLGSDFKNGDYALYVRSWREQYSQREKAIMKAAARLNEVRSFISQWHGSEAELAKLAAQPWFLERVFDIYLWEMGGEG